MTETMEETDQALRPPIDYFPMQAPREKQIKAMDFVRRAHEQNYTDIVIAAPTGIGKTGIGAAIALWAQQQLVPGQFSPGAYYLVTQKLLQDQIEGDFNKFLPNMRRGCSLKSSIEYPCREHGTCFAGLRSENQPCQEAANMRCRYKGQKAMFRLQPLSVTNYPYFFTERTYVGELPQRQVIIADECHTLEKQVLGFIEITINNEMMNEWAPSLRPVPKMRDIFEFVSWLTRRYMPVMTHRLEALNAMLESNPGNRKHQDELSKTENHVGRLTLAIKAIEEDENNWIYWQELKDGSLESIAKPISAVAFMNSLIFEAAPIRVYMSAYPGPKAVFCRNLGLEASKVAWLNLSSTFPKENRPIHMILVGSMGQKSIEQTLPSVQRMCQRILESHANEKGLIHCHSYKLGQILFDYLKPYFPERIIYPKTAKERDGALAAHANSRHPTVMLSPSMTEGFNMADDLARFQIIAKMPYPYLGDKQVAAKQRQDPEWYSMQTAMTVIQACGRIVRSDDDHGATYILDSDFQVLYERYPEFFPGWFKDAFNWYNKK
jgi:ATP-dependent DNA helicase DinG